MVRREVLEHGARVLDAGSSLVLKCWGEGAGKKAGSGRAAQEKEKNQKTRQNGKLQIPWKQLIPSEGSLQPRTASTLQGGPQYTVNRQGSAGWQFNPSTVGGVGSSWNPRKNQHGSLNSLLQNSEPS